MASTCVVIKPDGTKCWCLRYMPPSKAPIEGVQVVCRSCFHIEGAHPDPAHDSLPPKPSDQSKSVSSRVDDIISSMKSRKRSSGKPPVCSEEDATAEVLTNLKHKKSGGSVLNGKKKLNPGIKKGQEDDILVIGSVVLLPVNASKTGFTTKIPSINDMLSLTESGIAVKFGEKAVASENGFRKTWSSAAIDEHLKTLFDKGIFEWGESLIEEGKMGWKLLYKQNKMVVAYEKDASAVSGADLQQCRAAHQGKSWDQSVLYFGLTFDVPKEIWKTRNWTALPEASDPEDSDVNDSGEGSDGSNGISEGMKTRSQVKAKNDVATKGKGKRRATSPLSPTPSFVPEVESPEPLNSPSAISATPLFTLDKSDTLDEPFPASSAAASNVFPDYNPMDFDIMGLGEEPVASGSRGTKRAYFEEYRGRNTGLESPQRPSINPWKKARKA